MDVERTRCGQCGFGVAATDARCDLCGRETGVGEGVPSTARVDDRVGG